MVVDQKKNMGGEIMREKVEEALKLIRPILQGDGGMWNWWMSLMES
jgi:Fe-S cluster biogenesis protein NfuA